MAPSDSNGRVQLPSNPHPENAHPKDSEAGENSDDDEATAVLLNSALAKKKAMETKSAGLLGRARSLFKFSTPSTSQAALDQSTKDDGGRPPNLGEIMDAEPAAEQPVAEHASPTVPDVELTVENGIYPQLPEESLPVPPPIPSSSSLPSPKRKRDIYDVPDDGEAMEASEEAEESPKRRTRSKLKAKQQSNGQFLRSPNVKPTKSARPNAQNIIHPTVAEPLAGANTESDVKPKRGPGRPRRKPTSTKPPTQPPIQPPIQPPTQPPSPETRRRGRTSQTQPPTPDTDKNDTVPCLQVGGVNNLPAPGSGEGVSSILLDPSPIKVTRPNANQPPQTTQGAKSDSDFPDPADINSRRTRKDTPVESSNASEAPFHFDNGIIDFDLLETMLENANHVGHTFLTKGRQWKLKRTMKLPKTSYGKKLDQKLRTLNPLYIQLRSLTTEDDQDALHSIHTTITGLLDGIEEDTKDILSNRLGNPALGIEVFDTERTRKILVDLYFNIFPKLVESIKLGAEAYYENDSIETPLLEDLSFLVESLYNLSKIAIIQPKTTQPKPQDIPPKNKNPGNFHISQPTRANMPHLRILRGSIKDALSLRTKAEDRERRKIAALKHEEERKKIDILEREEKRRQKKAILRMQREDLDRQFNDPHWGKFFRENIERSKAAAEAKQAAKEAMEDLKMKKARRARVPEVEVADDDQSEERKRKTRTARQNRYEFADEEEDDPFQDDISEPRVSGVFGTNNKHQNGSPPWSEERKAEFLQFLSSHDEEEDRFERLAKRYQCTMDEVFDYAKEAQEAMDVAHEKGELTEPEYDWTYRIWEEVYEGSRGG